MKKMGVKYKRKRRNRKGQLKDMLGYVDKESWVTWTILSMFVLN
jgi:hypothetical protein